MENASGLTHIEIFCETIMNRVKHIRRLAEFRERFRRHNQNLRRPRIFRDREDMLDTLNDADFFQRYRMTRPMFYEILAQVCDDIQHNTQRNHALTAAQQLLIELRFLASGSFQQVIADTMKVNKSTVSRTITRVTKALLKLHNSFIYWPSAQECARIASIVYLSSHFPCVEGIIDGTHVRILKPHVHEQVYVNRKDYHSLNEQICGNGDPMIMDIVAKWPGSVNDSRILRNSTLYDNSRNKYYQI